MRPLRGAARGILAQGSCASGPGRRVARQEVAWGARSRPAFAAPGRTDPSRAWNDTILACGAGTAGGPPSARRDRSWRETGPERRPGPGTARLTLQRALG